MEDLNNNILNNNIAEDTSNILLPDSSAIKSGIVFKSNINSNVLNGYLNILSKAIQYLQFTVGLYSKEADYNEGNIASLVIKDSENYSIWQFRRNSNNPQILNNNPPITGASITTVNGIDIYEGGTLNTDWDKLTQNYDVEATPNTVMIRDEEGASNVNMPSNIENTTVVNNEYLEEQLQAGLSTKQDKLTAGTNVEITEDNVINVQGGVLNPYILSPRDLKQVLEATSVKDAFAKLRAKTSVGDFSNLRLGDYIDLETFYDGEQTYAWNEEHKNLRLVIVAFNHYYKVGDTEVTQQHVVMQFLNCYRQKRMHSTNDNAGGYPGKELQLFLNGTFKTGIVNAIGIEPLTIRRYLDTKTSASWTAEQCFLPTEVEVWGHQAWSNNKGFSTGTSIQYPYYSIAPQNRIKLYNGNRQWWWVASPTTNNASGFAGVHAGGEASNGGASSTTNGVAPALCI